MADWLRSTAVSGVVRDTSWAVPLTQTVHIAAIAALFTSATMLNARFAGLLGRAEVLSAAAVRFAQPAWLGFAVLAGSGVVLVLAEPHRELGNRLFWAKMALVAIAVTITAWSLRRVQQCSYAELSRDEKRTGLLIATVSTALWLLIIFCGRWIAYVQF